MAATRDSTSSEPGEAYPPLLSLAVHEFRTPAGVVTGYLRMLQRDGGDPLTEMQRKMITEAAKSCARLVSIVSELSDISKLDSGSISLTQQPLDVFAIAGDVATHMHEASERDVRLDLRGESAPAPAIGDPDRLRAAFEAIFRSILREKAGPCTVVAERRRGVRDGRPQAVVIVADEADVQAVYESAPGEFDERRGGMGLALPLARRVVERHGGTISAPASRGSDDRRPWASAIIAIPIAESTR